MDANLRTVLTFVGVGAVFAAALLAGHPRAGATQAADAGGNFEVPVSGWLQMRIASAE
ncbi:hypothetical protein [Methylobacterium sp. JK268]